MKRPELGPNSRCDLHLHTNRSDGRLTPEALISEAIACGLDVIALTDHDLTADIQPGLYQRDDKELFIIQGAEVTGVHEGREYHLLVYFPHQVPEAFKNFCQQQMAARRRRYQTAVENLGLDDIRTPDDYESEGTLALTRQHLAQALVAAGHASSLHDAFQNFANRDNVPIMDVPYTRCIEMAREMGATTSWAHPPVTDLKKHIETFKEAGLHGIEAMRPGLGATAKKTYKKMAKRHDLILTGGSDWHGWKDPSLGLFFVYQRDLQPFFSQLWASAA